jgi:carboxymethylenebutenolidase
MTDLDTVTTKVNLSQDDCQIEAYLAKLTVPEIYLGIVVLQEMFGVNVHILGLNFIFEM